MVESSSSLILVPSFLFNSGTGGMGEKVLKVHSRKKWVITLEDSPTSQHDVSLDPSPDSSTSIFAPPLVNDFSLPITVKKGIRTYVQYPMANYVSYHSLSSSNHRFAIELSSFYSSKCCKCFVSTTVESCCVRGNGFPFKKKALGILLIYLEISMLVVNGCILSNWSLMAL